MKVRIIQTGSVQIKSAHQAGHGESRAARAAHVMLDRHWSPRLPIFCTLIEHPEGLIVVDTGESAHANDPGYQPWWRPFMRFCERRWVQHDEEIGPRLQAMGLSTDDVRWVVMTHMHGDHAGGLSHFPKSRIIMSRHEAQASLSRRGPLQGYLNMHYPDWLWPDVIDFEDGPWESFPASTRLTRDGRVRLVPTPGHTLGHLSVAIERDHDIVLIAGDASYSEDSMLAGMVDGVAQNARLHRESTRQIRALCERHPVVTLYAHDPASPRRLESGAVIRTD
ncbi:MAG: N-acyl homoserine lactonase family protein [Lautropia sp.]|nr:N-acyl homoserine lactonase family protein [Lautropia sp.]